MESLDLPALLGTMTGRHVNAILRLLGDHRDRTPEGLRGLADDANAAVPDAPRSPHEYGALLQRLETNVEEVRALLRADVESPAFGRLLELAQMRFLYELIAWDNRGVSFLNLGYAAGGAAPRELDPEDVEDRTSIELYEATIGAVDLRDREILEVGCGCGGGASYVARYRGARSVVGVDRSGSNVRYCLRTHRAPGLAFRLSDAAALPFADETFDAVVNVESSHAYASRRAFLAEVRRVLRPGGWLLLADLCAAGDVAVDFVFPTLAALRADLAASGLVADGTRGEVDITAHVVSALREDGERRIAALAEMVPGFLEEMRFVYGTDPERSLCGALTSGAMTYVTCAWRKPPC
jgi:SAM-dependent methyltransferase